MPSFEIEKSFATSLVAGVDEAGRGPLAGPVVASAVIFKDMDGCQDLIKHLDDSKKLSAKKRQDLYKIIYDIADVGVGIASVEEIDTHNILQATFIAMNRAIEGLPNLPEIALIDGNHNPKGAKIKTQPIIKGDSKCFTIAAASIIAKVTRDNIMTDLDKQYPLYNWKSNSGYGVAAHISAIHTHGITPHHRKTFAPINQLGLGL